MDAPKYNKYVVCVPKRSAPDAPFPFLTLMNNELVPGCNIEVTYSWMSKIPGMKPDKPMSHAHDYDEIIINLGIDPNNPEDLGGEVVGFLGNETHTLNRTSAVFIPRNVEHGVAGVHRLDRPYILMNIKLR